MAVPETLGHNAPHGVVGIFNTNTDHKAATWITLVCLLFIAIIIVVGIIMFSRKEQKKIKPTPEETYQCKDGKCSLTQGSGGFATQSLCERNCKPAVKRWSCNVGDGTCAEGYGPGYSTEEVCKQNCSKVEKSWQCSPNGCRQMSLPGKQSYTFEDCTKKCKEAKTCATDHPPRCVSYYTDDKGVTPAKCAKDADCLSGQKYMFDNSIPGCTVASKDAKETFASLDDCMTKGGGKDGKTGKGCEGIDPARVYCKDAKSAVCAISQDQCCGVAQCDSCAQCVKAQGSDHGKSDPVPAYCGSSCTSKENVHHDGCFRCQEGECQCNPSDVYSELEQNKSCVCTVTSDNGKTAKYPCSVAKVMRNQGSVIESCDQGRICTTTCEKGNPYLVIVKARPKGKNSEEINVFAQACLTAEEHNELAQLKPDKDGRVNDSDIKKTKANKSFADYLENVAEDAVIANNCDLLGLMSNNLCVRQCNI